MARQKRNSEALNQANQRIIGITEINGGFDLGNGVSLASLTAKRDEVKLALDKHNQLIVQLDSAATQLNDLEKELRALNSRTLAGVRSFYGADSDEYEKAGGIRTSERKKPTRRSQPTA